MKLSLRSSLRRPPLHGEILNFFKISHPHPHVNAHSDPICYYVKGVKSFKRHVHRVLNVKISHLQVATSQRPFGEKNYNSTRQEARTGRATQTAAPQQASTSPKTLSRSTMLLQFRPDHLAGQVGFGSDHAKLDLETLWPEPAHVLTVYKIMARHTTVYKCAMQRAD